MLLVCRCVVAIVSFSLLMLRSVLENVSVFENSGVAVAATQRESEVDSAVQFVFM